MIVFTDRRGRIEIRRVPPKNMLLLARGRKAAIERVLAGCARLAYDNETWLVPGVPEADTNDAAVDAAMAFRGELLKRGLRPVR